MKKAKYINQLIHEARKGGWALWKLNFVLSFGVPFNRPHRFKIVEIGESHVSTIAPYRRSNFNHIKGIHACGIATISEFATGMLLMNILDPSEFRMIMSEMKMEYHYQAKKDLTATASMTPEALDTEVLVPLKTNTAIFKTIIAKVNDSDNNHVATAHITWQLKRWKDVKTRM